MNFADLLEQLSVRDVRLRAVDAGIWYDAPAAAMAPDLLAALREHRSALLEWLALAEPEVLRAPVSFPQERMLELLDRNGGASAWNIGLRLVLAGELDVAALDAALDTLVARHHSLRTRFTREAGVLVQRVLAHQRARLPFTDLTTMDSETAAPARLRRAGVLCRAFVDAPFALDREAPIRTHLLRVGAREHWLVIVLHHIAADGWGVSVLLKELAIAYRGALGGGGPVFAAPAGQCTDYARRQRAAIDDTVRRRRLAYWADQLGTGRLDLELPADHSPSRGTGRAGRHAFAVPARVSAAARELAAERGATEFAVFAAAMGVLLARLTGHDECTLAVPYANRDDPAHENTVTVAATALPLRVRVVAAATFGALVQQTVAGMFAAVDNLLPTAWIYNAHASRRGDAVPALPTVSLAYQSALDLRVDLPGLDVDVRELAADTARGRLMVSVKPEPDGHLVEVEYPRDRYEPATVRRWFDEYVDLLATGCAQGAGR